MHVKKGDIVKILAGKDRGKKAKVLQVLPRYNKVVVEGVNMTAKNVRPKQQGQKGQVVRYNAPIHASNVAPVKDQPATDKKSSEKKSDSTTTAKKSSSPKKASTAKQSTTKKKESTNKSKKQ